ncbi:MAG TPA: S8 family serine peptidase [Paraburkholderia sp.]|nr:S8 family serine peptidase [Paraburkholderia sp.]
MNPYTRQRPQASRAAAKPIHRASRPGRLAAYATTFLTAVLAACSGGGDSGTSSTRGGNDIQPQGDPLVQYQWHLKNTGQSAFSGHDGTPGIDLDVAALFEQGETGQGVRALVLDDGLDIRHPDLKDRVDSSMVYNFDPAAASTADPTPAGDNAHGTSVAGIIGASANKGFGVRGIAPAITLGGARILCLNESGDDPCMLPLNWLDAYGGAPFSQNADIINGSYGSGGPAVQEFDPDSSVYGVALQRLAKLRSGRGIVFVKAAGNSYVDMEGGACDDAASAGAACGNASLDPLNTMPQTLVVGAVNANGVKSSYSSAGSALLVAGLGGEYGINEEGIPAGPGIVTTDLAGCNRGSVKIGSTSGNLLNNPASPVAQALNPDCNYTATMNGTSAAAPTVSGVVALMLHANPQLTWRDVRTILMSTARQVDAKRVPTSVTLPDGGAYVPEPAWTRNGAGRWFDNWYGFGLVDAAAAVSMAKNYSTYLTGPMRSVMALRMGNGCSRDATPDDKSCGDSIAPGKVAGLSVAIPVNGSEVGTIEAVQLTMQLSQVSMHDMAVELISPAGTRSVLFNAFNGVKEGVGNVGKLTLASNAFNGESAQGVWQLRLIDVAKRESPEPGMFQGVKFNVMGH